MGYAIRITTRAVEVVSGADSTPGIVAAESTGVKAGLRAKWGGGELRSRPQSGRMVRQGNGWVLEGSTGGVSPYASYAPTPVSASFASSGMPSPYIQPGAGGPGTASTSAPPQGAVGLGFPSNTFGPGPSGGVNGHGHGHMRTPSLLGGQPRSPYTPSLQANGASPVGGEGSGHSQFSPTPNLAPGNGTGNGHGSFEQQQPRQQSYTPPPPPPPPKSGKKDD
jgi:hypothetical protein